MGTVGSRRAGPVRGGQGVDWFFACEAWTGEPQTLEPPKCAELAWFDLAALPIRMPEHEREALQALHAGGTANRGF